MPLEGIRGPRGTGILIVGATVTGGTGYALQLAAFQVTLVAFVEVLKRAVEIVAVTSVGTLVLDERLTLHKIAGIGLIVCGIPLMILPGG